MYLDEYSMRLYVNDLLEGARAAAARRALVEPHAPRVLAAVRAAFATLGARYARWSSAASAGSKPTTVRAWSRSR